MEVPRAFAVPRLERYMNPHRSNSSQLLSPVNKNAAKNAPKLNLIKNSNNDNIDSDNTNEGKNKDCDDNVNISMDSPGIRFWLQLTSIPGFLKQALRQRIAARAGPPLPPLFRALSHPGTLTKLLERASAASERNTNSIVEDIISGVKDADNKDVDSHIVENDEDDLRDYSTATSMAGAGEEGGETTPPAAAATAKTAPLNSSKPPAHISSSVSISDSSLPSVVNLEARNSRGETPLACACRKGFAAAVGLLLEHGANFNARDFRGCSPLILAAWHGRSRCVAALTEWAIQQVRARYDAVCKYMIGRISSLAPILCFWHHSILAT